MEIKIADDPVPLAAITGAATAFSAGGKAQLPPYLIPKGPQGQSQVGHKQQHWWHSDGTHVPGDRRLLRAALSCCCCGSFTSAYLGLNVQWNESKNLNQEGKVLAVSG